MLKNKMIFHMNNGENIIVDGTKENVSIECIEEDGRMIMFIYIGEKTTYIFPKDNICFKEICKSV